MKPKQKSKSTKLSPEAQKAKVKAKRAAESINELCSRARTALENGELDTAHELATKACSVLKADSPNVHPIELLGEIKIELGEIDQARECFLEAVRRRESVSEQSIEAGEEGKFLWLGQLSSEEEAVKWYTRGAETLLRLVETITDDEKRKPIHEKISEVYCSLIELYLTDLCMAEEAEVSAEKYALLALEHNKDSASALSLLASIRLSQTRTEDATSLLQQSVSKWLGVADALIPSYPERLNLVKLLLEVEQYAKALDVLATLEREDEENVELWYLYACAYYHDTEEAKEENWKSAKECAETCLRYYERMEWDDEELRNSCQEMLKEIQNSGIVTGKEALDEGDEEDDDDEWEDSEGDVEMEDA